MAINKLFAALIGVGVFANASMGLAVTIDFESLSHAGNDLVTVPDTYLQDGFSVSTHRNPQLPFYVWGTASPNFAGSTGVFSALGNPNVSHTLNLLLGPGGPFSVTSIDISPAYNVETTNRVRIHFDGILQNFGSITQTIDVPWFFGFQTFSLTGFNNLRSLRFLQPMPYASYVQFQFDNIVAFATPEPGIIALGSLGFLLLLALLPRRK
jgi:hypothetical protein